MAKVLDVTCFSSKRASLEADPNASLASLRRRAQRALGVGKGRLVNALGSLVDDYSTLETTGLRNGDCLTLWVSKVRICGGNSSSFAAILGDGTVVTWGDADFGGDGSPEQDQLKDVQEIQATDHAFAAIGRDGSVVSWGDVLCGGDSSAVQDKLKNVQQVQANADGFAAIQGDATVVTWSNEEDEEDGVDFLTCGTS